MLYIIFGAFIIGLMIRVKMDRDFIVKEIEEVRRRDKDNKEEEIKFLKKKFYRMEQYLNVQYTIENSEKYIKRKIDKGLK